MYCTKNSFACLSTKFSCIGKNVFDEKQGFVKNFYRKTQGNLPVCFYFWIIGKVTCQAICRKEHTALSVLILCAEVCENNLIFR